MTLFFQTVGGAFFISAGQTGFANRLLKEAPEKVPGVNPAVVVATGATDLRKVFSAAQLPGILVAYLDGIRVAFSIGLAVACVAFVLSFTPRWENLKEKKKSTDAA